MARITAGVVCGVRGWITVLSKPAKSSCFAGLLRLFFFLHCLQFLKQVVNALKKKKLIPDLQEFVVYFFLARDFLIEVKC